MDIPAAPLPRTWHRSAVSLLLLWTLAASVWFASDELNSRRPRFTDERYNVENVRSILESGSLVPANGFYGTLSYLPQAAALAMTCALAEATGARFLSIYEGDELSPLGYFLVRFFSCIYGTAAVLTLYSIGARVFSPSVGLMAALFLAGAQVHIYHSAFFKPEATTVM